MALAGPEVRSKPLPIGTVKGHVGHTEGASGVISLIEAIMMMMLKNYIPPQAGFKQMSRHINIAPDDMMQVATSLRPWDEERKVTLINNYGASGSKRIDGRRAVTLHRWTASSPDTNGQRCLSSLLHFRTRFPQHQGLLCEISGLPAVSKRQRSDPRHDSFNVNREANPSLTNTFISRCKPLTELESQLASVADADITPSKPERQVILCSGGQISTFVGLDRAVYESVTLLRRHLDSVDAILQTSGLGSLYPDIFSRQPIADTVRLQAMLFALQYACARSWLESGLSGKVAAMVGHSFGDLTALCISGTMSLVDTVRLVTDCARLVRDGWGDDRGTMMAVEADESVVRTLLDGQPSQQCQSASGHCLLQRSA